VRLTESDHKIVDDDGNVVLVLTNVEEEASYTCSIINEVAENTTTCIVQVIDQENMHKHIDQDVIKYSMAPMFVTWPHNVDVDEGGNVLLECCVDRCTDLVMSRQFLPRSIDADLIHFSHGTGNTFFTELKNVSAETSGLHFLTARNATSEVKYPVIIKVRTAHNLAYVNECEVEHSVGAPVLVCAGPVFARDGDDVTVKVSLQSGAPPFNIHWTFNDKPLVWSSRVVPYNVPGCIGVRVLNAGPDNEGVYICQVANNDGAGTADVTLIVDYPEYKESEVVTELCNCPMLDSNTPLMSWSNTPVGTPRRTPLHTPMFTPLATPRSTPRLTPLATPRSTPQRLLSPRDYNYRDSYRSFTTSSPNPHLSVMEDFKAPPQRKRFVQSPEIYSSFSSKSVEEGNTVELKCFVSCAPLTTTTWEKDGSPVISGSHVSLSEKTGVRVLTVNRVGVSDAGSYRMTITNSSGVANCSATIDVKRKTSSAATSYLLSPPSVSRSIHSPYSYRSNYSHYNYTSLGRRSTSRYL
jgi:hypothetical protein